MTISELHSITEIAPKSPLLGVKRSPFRYDFCAGAKTTWQGVNIA